MMIQYNKHKNLHCPFNYSDGRYEVSVEFRWLKISICPWIKFVLSSKLFLSLNSTKSDNSQYYQWGMGLLIIVDRSLPK